MKKVILFFILSLSVFVVHGTCDSNKVVNYTLNETYTYHAHDNDATPTDCSVDSVAVSTDAGNSYYTAVSGESATQPLHRLALKTNLLYDALLLPNVEAEWRFNDKWSVALESGIAWWGIYSGNKSYRLAMVSPEVKRWLRPRGPWHGIYIGAFAGVGLYDLEKSSRGYRGEGAMGGLSVGYMWPISRCLSLEAAVGAGYLYTRYKEYIPRDGHHVYQRTKEINYFGPLKAKFSLVWRLWDVNKLGNAKNKP